MKLASWPKTEYFFERIHVDFFSYDSGTYLITVDTYSKWIDVQRVTNTTANTVIEKFRAMFTYFGMPNTIVSDNGPPFDSQAIETFCKNNKIAKMFSPPYHPQSNGWAERAVRTVKKCIKKMACDPKTRHVPMAHKLNNFLLKYRNTPNSVNGLTPNDCIFNFRPRTLLSTLNEKRNADQPKEKEKRTERDGMQSNEKSVIKFKRDEDVLCKAEGNKSVKWMKAVVVSKESECTYKIKLEGGRIRLCHGDQLRKFYRKGKDIIIPPYNSQSNNEQSTVWDNLPFHSPKTPDKSHHSPQNDQFYTPPATARKLRQKTNVDYYEARPRKVTRKKKTTTLLNRSLNLTLD